VRAEFTIRLWTDDRYQCAMRVWPTFSSQSKCARGDLGYSNAASFTARANSSHSGYTDKNSSRKFCKRDRRPQEEEDEGWR
jgi:hypothetical protein